MRFDDLIDRFLLTLGNPEASVNLGWSLVGYLFVLGFFIYIAFALMVVRQVHLMTHTFKTGIDGGLKVAAYVHLVVAILVALFALFIV